MKRPRASEERKRKISLAGKGRPAWNKGKIGISEDTRNKLKMAALLREAKKRGD